MKKKITITAEMIPEKEGGYTVYCPELDIYTQGENIEDALANLREAAELHIEEIGVDALDLRKISRRKVKLSINA